MKKRKTRLDKNEIVKYEDYAEVILCDTYGEESSRVLIDLDDIDKISKYKWHLNKKTKYCMGSYKEQDKWKKFYIHRYIMNCLNDSKVLCDHINRDRLDCRKKNLRLVNHTQNHLNRGVKGDNSSGFIGVYWNKPNKKWCCDISKGKGETQYIGSFASVKEAVIARVMAEIKRDNEYRSDYNEKKFKEVFGEDITQYLNL